METRRSDRANQWRAYDGLTNRGHARTDGPIERRLTLPFPSDRNAGGRISRQYSLRPRRRDQSALGHPRRRPPASLWGPIVPLVFLGEAGAVVRFSREAAFDFEVPRFFTAFGPWSKSCSSARRELLRGLPPTGASILVSPCPSRGRAEGRGLLLIRAVGGGSRAEIVGVGAEDSCFRPPPLVLRSRPWPAGREVRLVTPGEWTVRGGGTRGRLCGACGDGS